MTPDQRLRAIEDVVTARAAWIDPDAGWDAAYQVGVPDTVVGTPLAPASVEPSPLEAHHRGEGAYLALDLTGAPATGRLLATCDATVAAAFPLDHAFGTGEGTGPTAVELYLSPDHCPDPAQVRLWHDTDDAGPRPISITS